MEVWTPDELELMDDAQIMLAKRRIIKKVRQQFATFREELQPQLVKSGLLKEIAAKGGKISHGENYKGLPYVILDYPSALSGDEVFTFRTMFWWGRYYSFNLLARGGHLEQVQQWVEQRLEALAQNGFYVATGNDLWENEILEVNYLPLTPRFDLYNLVMEKGFLRVNKPLPIAAAGDFLNIGLQVFNKLLL